MFNGKAGPGDQISSMQGSWIPFPETKADANARKTLACRTKSATPSREAYLGKVAEVVLELVETRYALERDAAAMIDEAARRWDGRAK
jgi:hypothetical protein